MSIKNQICKAENCLVDEVVKWIDKLNHGENTEIDDIKLIAMFEVIQTLCNYDFHPTRKVKTRSVIVPECDILNFSTNSLILYKTTCIELDPEQVNCLKPEELCPMIEQLSIMCENCNCNC